jgi:hypothetical protein
MLTAAPRCDDTLLLALPVLCGEPAGQQEQ